jgi:hypothetical protein
MTHFKYLGANRFECWVEEWVGDDFKVMAESKGFISGETFLIDSIKTIAGFKRKGYASQIVEKLLSTGKEVAPIGVLKTKEAQSFWKKFGMTDVLGPEDFTFAHESGTILEGHMREIVGDTAKFMQIKDGTPLGLFDKDEIKLIKTEDTAGNFETLRRAK